jgi:hypothetical protein
MANNHGASSVIERLSKPGPRQIPSASDGMMRPISFDTAKRIPTSIEHVIRPVMLSDQESSSNPSIARVVVRSFLDDSSTLITETTRVLWT